MDQIPQPIARHICILMMPCCFWSRCSQRPMYINWVVRKHENPHAAHVSFYDAYLMESFRDKAGIPRHRMLKYLGNIRQVGDNFPAMERELFLREAYAILQDITEFSEAEREDVLQQLHLKVPPLTWEEVEQGFRQNLYWYGQWCDQTQHPLPTRDKLEDLLDEHKPMKPEE